MSKRHHHSIITNCRQCKDIKVKANYQQRLRSYLCLSVVDLDFGFGTSSFDQDNILHPKIRNDSSFNSSIGNIKIPDYCPLEVVN